MMNDIDVNQKKQWTCDSTRDESVNETERFCGSDFLENRDLGT